MKNNYIRQAKEIKGKTTAYTEIVINATPAAVRAKFLDFKKWGDWNTEIYTHVSTNQIKNIKNPLD